MHVAALSFPALPRPQLSRTELTGCSQGSAATAGGPGPAHFLLWYHPQLTIVLSFLNGSVEDQMTIHLTDENYMKFTL